LLLLIVPEGRSNGYYLVRVENISEQAVRPRQG